MKQQCRACDLFFNHIFSRYYKSNVPQAEHRRPVFTPGRGAQAGGLSYVKLAAPYERK